MFLKLATVLAIAGITLGLLLSLIQQIIFTARFYGPGIIMLSRFISFAQIILFDVPLILFFVAFLLSLRQRQS